MLTILPFSSFPHRSSPDKTSFGGDLAKFSLELSTAVFRSPRVFSPVGLLSTPPMSGTPPRPSPSSQRSRANLPASQEAQRPSRDVALGQAPRFETGPDTTRSPPGHEQGQQLWPALARPSASVAPLTPIEGLPPPYLPPPQPGSAFLPAEYAVAPLGAASAASRQAAYHASPSSRAGRAPRRTKAHVASACVNCRNAHLSCDVSRPCARCVATGKQDSCVDVEHKKRGRPRIRGHAETRSEAARSTRRAQQHLAGPAPIPPRSTPISSPHTLGPENPRHLRSRSITSRVTTPLTSLRSLEPASSRNVPLLPATFELRSGYPQPDPSLWQSRERATAYLQMDFAFARASSAFCQVMHAMEAYFQNKSLFDIVTQHDWSRLERLRDALQDERATRDPAYLPPIYRVDVVEQLRHIPDSDIENYAQGSQERVEELTFVLPDGRILTRRVSFRLARTTVYFVVMVLLPDNVSAGPLLESQQTLSQLSRADRPTPPAPYSPAALLPAFVESPRSGMPVGGREGGEHVLSPTIYAEPRGGTLAVAPERRPSWSQRGFASEPGSVGEAGGSLLMAAGASPHARSQPSPTAARRRSEHLMRPIGSMRNYPPELQLPPIRGTPEAAAATVASAASAASAAAAAAAATTTTPSGERRPAEGRARDGGRAAKRRAPAAGDGSDEEGEYDDGRQRKRQRVSVEEILE